MRELFSCMNETEDESYFFQEFPYFSDYFTRVNNVNKNKGIFDRFILNFMW